MKALLLPLVVGVLCAFRAQAAPETNLKLTSGDFPEGGNIPARYTCDGADVSPGLRFDGLPDNTKSLALLVLDPDAPGGTFTHWIVWNIPVETKEFAAGSVPNGAVQGMNDFGKPGYGGPCPPSGVHRYVFHLYALDVDLKLMTAVRRAGFDKALRGHILAEATLTGRYGREPVAK